MSTFSKIRYILFGLALLWLIFVSYIYPINIIEISIVIFSFLLLIVNKKWTDYIALSVFTFWLIVAITFQINLCVNFELGCNRYLYLYLTNPNNSMIWLFLFSSIWIYLILSIIKRINK